MHATPRLKGTAPQEHTRAGDATPQNHPSTVISCYVSPETKHRLENRKLCKTPQLLSAIRMQGENESLDTCRR